MKKIEAEDLKPIEKINLSGQVKNENDLYVPKDLVENKEDSHKDEDDGVEDFLRTILDAGVGFLNMARKKVDHSIADMISSGKTTASEGEQIIDEFQDEALKVKDKFENRIKEVSSSFKERLDFASRKEYRDLQKQVADLEARLAAFENNNKV